MLRHPLFPLLIFVASCEGTEVSVSKTANLPPGVVINSPTDGSQFFVTEIVDLVGVVSDANGMEDIQVIQWNSSIQGELGNAEMVQPDATGTTRVSEVLEPGTHVVTLTATDYAGESSQASISVVIGADDPSPTAMIVKPVNFETFYEGDPIALEGLVADPQYANDRLEVVWYATDETTKITSELDSEYADSGGSTVSVWTNAPAGSYTITLEAFNPDGYSAEDEAFITIGDPGDVDADNDTYSPNEGDCDDNDASIYPGAPELADGKDNDCDGVVDEGTELFDDDGDGYCESVTQACSDGSLPGDCNDANALINPAATEACDGVDNDCDGTIDEEDASTCEVYFYDGDQDTFGSEDQFNSRCLCAPSGLYTSFKNTDCNDTKATIYPGANEIVADEIDQDCDGNEICYVDADNDNYVVDTLATVTSTDAACDGPGEASASQLSSVNDCDDANTAINPGQAEIVGDEIDSNCDGQELCYVDADGDGYIVNTLATVTSTNTSCSDYGEAKTSQLQSVNDCNDTAVTGYTIHPGATEIPGDEVDQNCDGQEICYIDADGDGYVEEALGTVTSLDVQCDGVGEGTASQVGVDNDCDDSDKDINPGVSEEIGDGIDQDCDGDELCYIDADGDGYILDTLDTVVSTNLDCTDPGEAEASQLALINDCDDSPSGFAINPAAAEIVADEIDQDCDGQEICYVDDDDDGYIVDTLDQVVSNDALCDGLGEASSSELEAVNDCDDTNSSVNPGAAEIPGDATDQNCDGEELCYHDHDTDGYAATGTGVMATADINCTTVGLSLATEIVGLDDCNDNNASINPGAFEAIGDEVDSNCDGQELCYIDYDNDYFVDNSLNSIVSSDTDCDDAGEASASQLYAPNDCDDTNNLVNPAGTEEIGDEIDQNCDGIEVCYFDNDNDGYIGDAMDIVVSSDTDCDDLNEAASSALAGGTDCDDNNSARNPGAVEQVDNGFDENCDGYEKCYVDQDGDGYIDGNLTTVDSDDLDCSDPGESSYTDLDCDDTPGSGFYIHPGAEETPGDGIDQDCDQEELCYEDADNDSFIVDTLNVIGSSDADCDDYGEADNSQLTGTYDCNDNDANIHPNASEGVGDEVDQNCDGKELCYVDSDGDGYIVDSLDTIESGDTYCTGYGEATSSQLGVYNDCNDTPGIGSTIYPGATEEIGDEIDSDCDGNEICYRDDDDDGYVAENLDTVVSTNSSCNDSGEARDIEVRSENDCDDGNQDIHPGAYEEIGDEVDQNCDGQEICYVDADGDGYIVESRDTVSSPDIDCTGGGEARSSELLAGDDCNDSAPNINPGAYEEIGDELDSNCDGLEVCYVDDDNDGYIVDTLDTLISNNESCTDVGEARSSEIQTVNDCNDDSPYANPLQTNFFESSLSNGSFDYNCDTVEEKEDTRAGKYSCTEYSVIGLPASCSSNAGWANSTSAPACGQTDVWVGACYYDNILEGCEFPPSQYVTQRCR